MKSYLQQRIARALKARFGARKIPFAFVFELTESGRLHLHGVIYVPEGERRELISALRCAGGKWDAWLPEKQADIRELWNAAGWGRYCTKTASRTRQALGVKSVLSMSREMNRIAKSYWTHIRRLDEVDRAKRRNSGSISFAMFLEATDVRHIHLPAAPLPYFRQPHVNRLVPGSFSQHTRMMSDRLIDNRFSKERHRRLTPRWR
ncbi:hypothetical protein [Nitratireductor alexandrii]|uniref:hypothetical protein n=1 Tax=Nitratireductor alexandrii TaxID=2448161 RepID=UPI000FDA3A2A|nr:hypothetical protein [Nitratireductor alexandrii]